MSNQVHKRTGDVMISKFLQLNLDSLPAKDLITNICN